MPRDSGLTNSERWACQVSKRDSAVSTRSLRTGPLVGDMVENPHVLPAPDLLDGQPSQRLAGQLRSDRR